jgi:hypothetical protein
MGLYQQKNCQQGLKETKIPDTMREDCECVLSLKTMEEGPTKVIQRSSGPLCRFQQSRGPPSETMGATTLRDGVALLPQWAWRASIEPKRIILET